MKIRELRVRAVLAPMSCPHKTASGTITESPIVLTDLLTEEGVIGHSYVFTYGAMALRSTALLVKAMEPLITGREVEPLEIDRLLSARFRLLGLQGLAGMATAAIDMALWDALARAQQLPLVRLLGAAPRPIQAYGSVGYEGPAGCVRTASEWVARGFKAVKLKIGYPDVREDVEVIRAVRGEVGDDVAIMIDYNQSLTPAEAIARGRRLDDEGLTWIEEPTLADDFAGHAAVAKELRTPVQAGENWWGPHDVRKAIAAGATDYIMADVMKIGGVTGWLRTAALAEAHSIPLSSHLFGEIDCHLLSAAPTAHWLEYVDWFRPILAQPLEVVKGFATPDDCPGSGIEWDERAVARYLVE